MNTTFEMQILLKIFKKIQNFEFFQNGNNFKSFDYQIIRIK